MSDFSVSQRGCYTLHTELDEAGENYDQLCNLIMKLQIKFEKFPRTPEDARTLIQEHIGSVSRSFYNVRDQMIRRSEGLVESLCKWRQHQLECQTFYKSAAKEFENLNKLMTCQLNIYRPHFMEEIKQRTKRLEEGRIKILILGEICAGKSSVLNMLMDGQYFPVAQEHCTRIPCEVRNGAKPYAYLYDISEPWAPPTDSFPLSTNPEDSSWMRVQKCIKNGYDQTSDSSTPLQKIIIRWPLKIFQTRQMEQLQRDLKKKQALQQVRSGNLTASEPVGFMRKIPVEIYSRSEQKEVLKPASLKKPVSAPTLEFVSPYETSRPSPETESEATDTENESPAVTFRRERSNNTSENFNDTLTLINGITFVDAPGIYDTDESFLNLQPYIQSCDAFMFVLSNAENHGLARDRVMKLMEIVQKTCEERNQIFNPHCAIFLCNKWDLVDDEYKETRQNTVLNRLRECWPTVSRKQIFPISGSRQILREIQNGKVPALYEEFYYGVCSFIEKATGISIESNCWWMTTFLDRLVVLQKKAQAFSNFSRQQRREVKDTLTEMKKSMLEISGRQKSASQEIEQKKEAALRGILDRIKVVLKKNLIEKSRWTECDIPARETGLEWKKYQHELNRAIAKRLEQLILDDEETESLVDNFEREVKEKLYDLKTIIMAEDARVSYLQPLTASMDPTEEKDGILSKSRFPFFVLAVVFTLPLAPLFLIFWHIFEELFVPILQDDEQLFQNSPQEYMKKQTEIFVSKIIKERLSEIAEARLQGLSGNAKHMMQFFFTCIENRLNSIDELVRQIENETVVRDNHKALTKLTTGLSRFYIKKIMKHEIHSEYLRVDTDNPAKMIGTGHLTYVVKGEYFDEKSMEVAVKVIKWPMGEEEAIFRECFILRQLSQKPEGERSNFVKFFGSTFEESNETFKILLVCELCLTDLAKMVEMDKLMLNSSGDGVLFPGNDASKGRGWSYFFNLAKQAANGLQFVHNNGIIHRDVKPANFLINFTADGTIVKIADVGLSRSVDLNVTTKIGTKIYSAPEVQLGTLHSFSGDIYSLCLVLFELWYGETIPFQLPAVLRWNFHFPAPKLRNTRPPHSLEDVMKAGWSYNPSQRPNIGAVIECLSELEDKYK